MKLFKIRPDFKKSKIPAVILLLSCFILVALTADYAPLVTTVTSNAVIERKTIVLDAGHGGMDSGAVGVNGELEKNINLAIVKNLRDILLLSGFNVVLTRETDISIHDDGIEGVREQKISDMKNRLDIIQHSDECIFISVHQNKYTESQYKGAQIFYNTNNPDNRQIAQIMQDNFRLIQPYNNREIKQSGDELYLFKSTYVPAVLIECGFLSNPEEAVQLNDEQYQKKIAFVIYDGIIQYLLAK